MINKHSKCAPTAGAFASVRTAYEVIAEAVQSNATIESLTLVTYEEGPNWRDLRRGTKTADLRLLLKGVRQDQGQRRFTMLSRKEVSAENLRDLGQRVGKNRLLLGVISRVSVAGGRSAHIPMMDFMCGPSKRNLEVLVHLLNELYHGRGYLLESGRSYHYYAFRLLTEEEWRVFLGKCLLMSGYTDDRYIGHQLVDGHCVLRLSSGRLKDSLPRVVAEFS